MHMCVCVYFFNSVWYVRVFIDSFFFVILEKYTFFYLHCTFLRVLRLLRVRKRKELIIIDALDINIYHHNGYRYTIDNARGVRYNRIYANREINSTFEYVDEIVC